MSNTKFLKRLIKKIYIKWIKKYPHFLLFSLEFLCFLIFQTQYPAPPNTQQHHNMKSNLNIECLAKKIPIPSTSMHWPIESIPCSMYTTSQNSTCIWFPHWPPWMWRISHIFTFFVNCFSWESDKKLGGKICKVLESLSVFVIRNLGVYSEGFSLC